MDKLPVEISRFYSIDGVAGMPDRQGLTGCGLSDTEGSWTALRLQGEVK